MYDRSSLALYKWLNSYQVSNARIMDQGTSRNILTELHITSDQYNFVTLAYYVRKLYNAMEPRSHKKSDTIHPR